MVETGYVFSFVDIHCRDMKKITFTVKIVLSLRSDNKGAIQSLEIKDLIHMQATFCETNSSDKRMLNIFFVKSD